MLYAWSHRNMQALRPYVFASYLPILFFVGGAGVVNFVTVPQVLAHEDKNPYANFKAGEVTGIQGAGIQIDNTNYPMILSLHDHGSVRKSRELEGYFPRGEGALPSRP